MENSLEGLGNCKETSVTGKVREGRVRVEDGSDRQGVRSCQGLSGFD